MNREILFRGKRVDNGEWVIGDGIHYPKSQNWKGTCWIDGMHERANDWVQVVPETVGQYTGLTDKNGTKIFEGDIVKWFSKKYTVVYKDGCFIGEKEHFIGVDEYGFINLYGVLEVIGNIHEQGGCSEYAPD